MNTVNGMGPDDVAGASARAARCDRSLARAHGRAIALLGLGSVGRETDRIDAWSDLDFFAIVRPGEKARFVESLEWLAEARPIVWAFRNTADGSKVLMADGIFCEMAVFKPTNSHTSRTRLVVSCGACPMPTSGSPSPRWSYPHATRTASAGWSARSSRTSSSGSVAGIVASASPACV